MILPRSIRFPISLTLGAGFKLVFAPASAPRRNTRYGATLSVPYDCYLYSTTETGAEELEAMSCGFGPADALVSLMVELAEVEPALPAEVALALGDLSHEALDTIKERISSRPTGEVVFAEPVPTPEPAEAAEYDPKTHVWRVGDWFMLVYPATYSDLKFLNLCGAGPHRVADTLVYYVQADKAGSWFALYQIRPCAPPTEEAVFADPVGDPAPVEVPVQAERERTRLRPMSEAPKREYVAVFCRGLYDVSVVTALDDNNPNNIGWLSRAEFLALFSAPNGKELEP